MGSVALVRSGQVQGCVATGGATHLGRGRFLTAAHVADGSVQRLRPGCAGAPVAVTLSVHGAESPARVLVAGLDRVEPGIGQRYLGGVDAALVAPSRALPPLPAAHLCARDPVVGEAVLLATPVRSLRTAIVDWHRDRDPDFGAYPELPLELAPGESGGAVFAREGCLLGLVSHRDSDPGPVRTRIVPAPVLRRLAGD